MLLKHELNELPWVNRTAVGSLSPLVALFLLFCSVGNVEAGDSLALYAFTENLQVDTPPPLHLTPGWASIESDSTLSVAWGDVDNDGDLDLALGNWRGPVRLYLNDGRSLSTTAVWSSAEADEVRSIAWGDVDGDGDLDLAVGNDTATPNRLYLNEGGALSSSAAWASTEEDSTWSIAWGDVDGDGDLDLAVGNWNNQNRLYLNNGGSLATEAIWSSTETDETTSVVWGDVDGDGDLDLAAGSHNSPNRLYLNDGGTLSETADWSSAESDLTWSIAWGDVDGDGDLDLAVGNDMHDGAQYIGAPNRLYLNEGGILSQAATWNSTEFDASLSMAWGDVDGDGDLDLAVGNRESAPNRIYRNDGGALAATAAWSSEDNDETRHIAWGDVDGDSDLDLAAGNDFGDPNRLYINDGISLAQTADWSSNEIDDVLSVAWGDVDGDGDLDLAVGTVTGVPSRLYLNADGLLSSAPAWISSETDETRGIAWGDVDGDGDLDLAVGNDFPTPNRLYRNEGGTLTTAAVWSSPEAESTLSVAWGDADGDGDLDLAVGNWQAPNRLYRNDGGVLSSAETWESAEADETLSVAWGDVDGDGDLDLAAGNWNTSNQLYLNGLQGLSATAAWSSAESDETTSVAWADVDNDGDLDLAAGNRNSPNRLYRNQNGQLEDSAFWSSNESDSTLSMAWGDVDDDGDLDLAVGNGIRTFDPTSDVGVPNRLYLNNNGVLLNDAAWSSESANATWGVAWGDMDGDGDLDLAAGNRQNGVQTYVNLRGSQAAFPDAATVQLGMIRSPDGTSPRANYYATERIHASGHITLPFVINLPQLHNEYNLEVAYSLDGGGRWHPAVGMVHMLSAGQAGKSLTGEYIWDVYGSNFYGQSDNVVIRMALAWECTNPCMRPAVASQSFPVRVRGTQVHVQQMTEQGKQPVAGAIVYRIPAGQNTGGQAITDINGKTLLTNNDGFFQGRGSLDPGDYLFAMAPISATEKYTVYVTSAQPTTEGFIPVTNTVGEPGVQELTVSADNPFILFNLTLSLEWDARYDTSYLQQLRAKLQRTSELLYDWTNGQAALGDTTIYHAGEAWEKADIRVHVNNQLRPHATIGGVVRRLTLDTIDSTGQGEPAAYLYQPGHVEMGAVWNRYGEPGEQLSEDWERTLAHELGHYLFYLHDNYAGLDADGQIIRIEDCPGVMSNPYVEILTELHPAIGWIENCASTFSQHFLGQHDWATVKRYYHWLHEPSGSIDDEQNAGPNVLPLAVTQLRFVEPDNSDLFIDVPSFPIQLANGSHYVASPQARVYLFHAGRLIDLGAPDQGTLALARGARPNDTICVYDLGARNPDGALTPLTGCQTVQTGGEVLELSTPVSGWQPDVVITPDSAQTLTVSIGNVTPPDPAYALEAQLYSQDGAEIAQIPLSFDGASGQFIGTFSLEQPVRDAYLHVRQPDSWARGVVLHYNIAGAPTLLLGEGNTLMLTNGSTLTQSSGITRALQPGDLLTVHRGLVQIHQPDDTILILNDGDSQPLAAGDTVLRNDAEIFTISEDAVLSIHQGQVIITQQDGFIFTLLPGDILELSLGTGLVLADTDISIVLWFLDGGAHSMSEGDALSMSEGDILRVGQGGAHSMSEGDALSMSEGDILRIASGRASIFADSQIPVVDGGSASYIGHGDAPVRSSDGQVSLYGNSLNFEKGQFYTLQPTSILPDPPLWATTVGQAYRVTASMEAPNLDGLSISMNYIGRTVDDDKEPLLTIYYWNTDPTISDDKRQWQALQSKVDDEHNTVSAKAVDVGIYILMYSFDITISGDGWSILPYPVLGSRPITAALSSIDPYYQLVYHYNELQDDPFQRWRLFAKAPVPAWVNTLHDLEFGHTYWLSATHTSSLTIKFADQSSSQVQAAQVQSAGIPIPPATYYGYLTPDGSFTPTADASVEAYVGDELCGVGQTSAVENGKIGYVVIVYADDLGERIGCGASGRKIRIDIDGQPVLSALLWNSDRINQVDNGASENNTLHLPIVLKQ